MGEELRTWPVFEERLVLRWLLSSIVDERSLPEEVTVSGCKTVDSDADETGSIHSQDEGHVIKLGRCEGPL